MQRVELTNFIKYCLGYIRLARRRTFSVQQKTSAELNRINFDLNRFLNNDVDSNLGELINLELFYNLDPKQILPEKIDIYTQEKILASRIDDIYNFYKNDQYTKQILLNFGFFEIEMPSEFYEDETDFDNEEMDEMFQLKMAFKKDKYPLFSLPIKIEKEFISKVGKFYVYPIDIVIQVNIGMMESILSTNSYYELVERIGRYEIEGDISIPLASIGILTDIWHEVKDKLKYTDARFDENSFCLEEMTINLSPRSNYFLAEDLRKLAKMSEEELSGTSLNCWVEDSDLDIESEISNEGDLYFPFTYDKYQLDTLSIINNKGAIILGPPGTGKSQTIANLLCHLVANKKRVLFVSQKAQALKVVKDKLKKLNVKYLFGYIPNPRSGQLTEEDEIDGIAPQLSALESYVTQFGYNYIPRQRLSIYYEDESNQDQKHSLGDLIMEKSKIQSLFETTINSQKKYFELYSKLNEVRDYDINISNIKNFFDKFSLNEYELLKDLIKRIKELGEHIQEYVITEEKNKFDELFANINSSGSEYLNAIEAIKDDVEKTGYDKHSKIVRKFNIISRNIRLKEFRGKLPKEIVNYIDGLFNKNISKINILAIISSLYMYFEYCHNLSEIRAKKQMLSENFDKCGLTYNEYEAVDKLISDSLIGKFDQIKQFILEANGLKKDLNKLDSVSNLNDISYKLKSIEENRFLRISQYIQNIINETIKKKWKEGITIRQVIRKLAKVLAKSKRAFRTFDNLRKDPEIFDTILNLIPIWIMELDDASRIIPLRAGIFDYLILDEASQCNVAYTLPSMYRSKKILLVGDTEQMRDNTILFKSNKAFDELACRYQISDDLQIKATGSEVQSVLNISYQRGFKEKYLRYHYRSPAELIGFSNKYFYKPKSKQIISLNNNYLTYKDTNRIMLIHLVQTDSTNEFSDKINIEEAKAILRLFEVLRDDDRYREKSVGILTFFNAQATYIRSLFEENGYKEEKDNYKVSIIEGIQGDEKDIILYSFVINIPDQKNKYIPLTGEGGDKRSEVNKGRVNVAFSRARLQAHCFISMPIDRFPKGIWLKKYIDYIQENGELDNTILKIRPFESYFEEEFYHFINHNLEQFYRITNQVESCGFRIDFVITNTKNGESIAVECDGPTHFENEVDQLYGIHVDSDEERQKLLEAVGWNFYRLKYSDWIDNNFDRNRTIVDIKEYLNS